MKTPPADLDPALISSALSTHWGQEIQTLEYAPLGFGSHHWFAETASGARWFVTVDDLQDAHLLPDSDASFRCLEMAFGTAASLRDDAGLPFVIAPVATEQGQLLHRLTSRYSLALFPHLDVVPGEFGAFGNEEDRVGALRLVGQLHAASDALRPEGLRRDTLVIPGRMAMETMLRDTGSTWTGGPYAEPARELLQRHVNDVRIALDWFDALVREVSADTAGWVITHGEPHAANIVRTSSGEQVIVDWDPVAFAPPERDLRMLIDQSRPDWSAYQEITGLDALSETALEAYQLHWDLSEVAIYLAWSRAPHGDTEEMRIAWRELGTLLPSLG